MRLFKFCEMKSRVFSCLKSQDVLVTSSSKELVSDEDWGRWLDEKKMERLDSHQSSMTLLIGGRAKPRIPGMEVAYLPFPETVCTRIVDVFQIHRSISRVINRNTTATFSTLLIKGSSANRVTLVYNCRSSSAWANDLGLSVTYSPHYKTTKGVLYGCCEEARDKFIDRLKSCDFTVYHPLTLPTIFAEIERQRHFNLLNPMILKLVERVKDLDVTDEQQIDTEETTIGRPSISSEKTLQANETSEDYVELWLRISWLRNGLEDWKRQLQKMIAHCNELQQASFHIPERSFQGSTESTPINASPNVDTFDQNREFTYSPSIDELGGLEDAGSRIHQKLLELEEEYNEKIRTCATVIDGMALAAQLDWNKIGRKDTKTNLKISKSNLVIAEATKRDGRRMRSIAVLTMIFLPATFVATVFSMTFFNWTPDQGQAVLSPYIWVYVVGTTILTGLTMGLWHIYSRRDGKYPDAEKR